jgi:hypothetical protein
VCSVARREARRVNLTACRVQLETCLVCITEAFRASCPVIDFFRRQSRAPGLAPTSTLNHCRADRVYVTTNLEEAAIYAALAPAGGRGGVYAVKAVGALEPDPPGVERAWAFATRTATIVAVVRRAVGPSEAMARMRAASRAVDIAVRLDGAPPPQGSSG